MKHRKKTLAAFALCALMLAMPNTSIAKTWKGKWGGNASSTLEFLEGKRVRYCFRKECVIKPYTGNKSKKVFFRWGRASFTMEWNGQGYNGLYRSQNQRSTILYE